MTRLELIRRCEGLFVSDTFMHWLRGLDVATAREAWDVCDRLDWLLWLAVRADLREQAVQLACDYAERVLPIAETWLRVRAPEHAEAPRRAIEAARRGEVTQDAVAAIRAAVRTDYWANLDPARAHRAYAAAYAAYCAAYRDAAGVAYWAARAADNDVTERAWQLSRLREVITWDDVERGLRGAA